MRVPLPTGLLLVAAVPLVTFCGGDPAPPPPSATLALVNVNVIPMDEERVIEGQTILVDGDRIVAMGAAADTVVPPGAETVRLDGKYVMPALGEMHGHLAGADEDLTERILALNVAYGVLTVRSMQGHPAQLELRDRIARGEVIGPRIYTSGPSARGGPGASVNTPEEGERLVREQHAAGYDLIKIHPGVPRPAFDALAATAKELGIPFAGHVPVDVGVDHAIESGYRSIDHLDGYAQAAVADGAPVDVSQAGFFGSLVAQHLDHGKIPGLVAKTRDAGVWVVPTETLLINFLSEEPPEQAVARPEMRYLPRALVQQWEDARRAFQKDSQFSTPENRRRVMAFRAALIQEMQKQGVGILLGADSPQVLNVPGVATHDELAAVVRAGLTPYQALLSGTRNVAVFFGTEAETGTVEVGKRADLLVLDANPLADIASTTRRAGVVAGGTWHTRASLDARLEALASTR